MTKKKTKKEKKHSYEDRTDLHGIISKNNYDYIASIRDHTVLKLGKIWTDNVKYNQKYWKKHAPLKSCTGLCKNKVIIGVGASSSFNKNKDVLKEFLNKDGAKPWEDRDFVTIAANHQYKPLLEMGIIPDFVLLVDASDVVMDQLTKDIPKEGQHTTLITGVHCNPKVIETWTKQGRGILFYVSPAPDIMEAFKKHVKKNPFHYKIELGGNVINGAWMIGVNIFHSTVFMCVGNDLSFPVSKEKDDQRKTYYADKDYSSNIKGTGTGRDEASSQKKWAGFSMERRLIALPGEPLRGIKRYNITLDIVGTSPTLWVYKNWLESTMLGQTQHYTKIHYFNCTEGGILGVMAKEDNDEALKRPDNWYMLDEVCINKQTEEPMYHTAMLEDAMQFLVDTKEKMRWQGTEPISNVRYVKGLEAMN